MNCKWGALCFASGANGDGLPCAIVTASHARYPCTSSHSHGYISRSNNSLHTSPTPPVSWPALDSNWPTSTIPPPPSRSLRHTRRETQHT